MEFSEIVVAGLVAAVIPTLGGILAFMRFAGGIEESVKGLRRDVNRVEERLEANHEELNTEFKSINDTMAALGERAARLEAKAGLS